MSATADPSRMSGFRAQLHLSRFRDYAVLMFAVAMFVVLAISTPTFLTSDNMKNLVDGSVAVALLAIGGTIVIIAGGFDLSSGAIFVVSAIVGAKASNEATPVVGIAAGMLTGAGLGLVNGLLCTVGRANPFVGTLGTMIAFTGLATLISGSGLVVFNDESFGNLATRSVVGIHMSTWILIAVAPLCGYVLNRTVFGQHVFGVGGNPAAARLSGVPIGRTVTYAFVISGALAALGGLIVSARSLTVSPAGGSSIIFDALAAILIGGNSIFGGEGAIWRTLVGVAVLAMISNGFNLNGVDPLYQQIVSGTIIIVAITTDAWTKRRT